LFAQPEAFFTPESIAAEQADPEKLPVKLPGIGKMAWIERQDPEEVYPVAVEADAKSKGFEVVNKGEYGGGNLYELQQQGQVITRISLIKTKGGKGTIMVIWNRDPNQPL
jgi:hypothetical protein